MCFEYRKFNIAPNTNLLELCDCTGPWFSNTFRPPCFNIISDGKMDFRLQKISSPPEIHVVHIKRDSGQAPSRDELTIVVQTEQCDGSGPSLFAVTVYKPGA